MAVGEFAGPISGKKSPKNNFFFEFVVIIDSYKKSSTGSSVSGGCYCGILLSDLRMEAAQLRKSRKTQKAVLDFAYCMYVFATVGTSAFFSGNRACYVY